jgi:cytochrome c-type protein NapB
MTLHRILIVIMLLTAGTAFAGGKGIPADSMGLSKSSVFKVPAQKAYSSKAEQPGQNELLPRAYPGAPPQIPHSIADFLPITTQSNMCIACHANPGQWGQKREKGTPTPIPPSHYTDRRNAPDKVTDHLMGARFNCNQCHVPQLDAKPLVENTFSAGRKR